MTTTFFELQKEKITKAFELYEAETGNNIRNFSASQCLEEFAKVPNCKELVKELIAAKETEANLQVEGVFAASR